ncbi:MAG: amidohydrolase family protein [Phycisphaerae bacterium]|nr:amidohydrolase family protein [Phycisphaerae bacterium]
MINQRSTTFARDVARRAAMACAICMLAPAVLAGDAPASRTLAIRAKSIYPVTPEQPGPICDATLIVRDGKVVALGRDVAIPVDAVRLDFPDASIVPGFVLAASGLTEPHSGDRSASGAYAAIDEFDPYADFDLELATGVTTVHLSSGTHRLVSGRGAVVKLSGPPEARILAADSDLQITLGPPLPPLDVEYPFYASSDVAITPSRPQSPQSRLTQFLELSRVLRDGAPASKDRYDHHAATIAAAVGADTPLRIEVRSAADIEAAVEFLAARKARAYLVGAAEGDLAVESLTKAGLPIVLRMESEFRFPGQDLGPGPEVIEESRRAGAALGRASLRVALAGRTDAPGTNPQLIAALALRSGMTRDQVLAGLTRVPAEILGVADRVGSLAAGKDADFVVVSGPPLDLRSRVLATFVDGKRVIAPPAKDDTNGESLVIRAGTLWLGDGQRVSDGEILVRDGKIAAIGQRVPAPPFSRRVDAGPSAYVTPGFIDAHGHLGLGGDRTSCGPDVALDTRVSATGREFVRVARGGVTTVLLSAYNVATNGGRVSAIKTYGSGQDELVTKPLAGLKFSIRGQDPLTAAENLRRQLDSGKKYVEKWKKYEEDLKKWESGDRSDAKKKEGEPAETEVVKVDPITGTWSFRLSGGPLPEEVTGTLRLKLTGDQIEGRLMVDIADEETVIRGKLDGDRVTLEFEEETPIGKPTIEAKLSAEDTMDGELKISTFALNFSAKRTNKDAVEFKVSRKKRKSKDGRPEAPPVDENMEPYRAVLGGAAPAFVSLETAAQAEAVLKLFVDENKLSVVLLGAEDIADLGEKLESRKESIGVAVPPQIVRWRDRQPYHQAADLSDRSIRIAFQSDAEDAARNLSLNALFAVQQGLGGDAALRALTSDAAKMLKLDDKVGTLAPGRDADLLIFSGYPMDAESRLERVFVGGREVPTEPVEPN